MKSNGNAKFVVLLQPCSPVPDVDPTSLKNDMVVACVAVVVKIAVPCNEGSVSFGNEYVGGVTWISVWLS